MTNWASWFRSQLQASGEAFAWSAEQLSRRYDFALPERRVPGGPAD